MSEPNNHYAAMVNMIPDTETMFEDCGMILSNDEMVHTTDMIFGDKIGHDGEMSHDYKTVGIHDDKIIHGSDMVPGSMLVRDGTTMHSNQVLIHGSDMGKGSRVANGNDTAEVRSATIHGVEMVYGSRFPDGNDTAELTPTTTSRCQRRRSTIWEHFTKEVQSEGSIQACCNHCKKEFAYICGKKLAGTSHLWRHFTNSCPVLHPHEPLSAGGTDNGAQGTTVKCSKRRRKSGSAKSSVNSFNQDHSLSYLAKMIIVHDYPLHIAQQPSFVSFVKDLQPCFKVIDVVTMEAEVYAVYSKERNNLLMEMENIPGRINLSVGMWTTNQTLGYVSIAGQFIDLDWKLRKRMLNFIMTPLSCPENAVSEAIHTSLSKWNMDKLFAITVDYDSTSHDIQSVNLRDHVSEKGIQIFGGQFSVVRCYTHMLNSAACDVTTSVMSVIYKIRESIKFINSCPRLEHKFYDIVQHLQISSTQILSLDISTQWNTTYLMLLAALDYRQAFTMLETCYDNYNEAPSETDWKKVEVACRYLKLLYDSAHSIMGTAEPTANIYFYEAWTIQREISVSRDPQDPILSCVTKEMHERLDKYWKDHNIILAIAVVMDPRFKMKIVEFSYSKLYGLNAKQYIRLVDDAVHKLYKDYVTQALPSTASHVQQGGTDALPTNEKSVLGNRPSNGHVLSGFDSYLLDVNQRQVSKSELDQYLEETILPRVPEFDILSWWKSNSLKYPTLSRIARDVLAIPVAAVGSGSSVLTAGPGARMLDDYRSSLRPETVEALFCAKDWLQHSPPAPKSPSST